MRRTAGDWTIRCIPLVAIRQKSWCCALDGLSLQNRAQPHLNSDLLVGREGATPSVPLEWQYTLWLATTQRRAYDKARSALRHDPLVGRWKGVAGLLKFMAASLMILPIAFGQKQSPLK